jgi:phosphate starvation-inducible protein PhoH and related proteins
MADESFPSPAFFDPLNADTGSRKAAGRKQRKEVKEVRQLSRTPKPIVSRSVNQTLYMRSIEDNELTFGVGPAGVGKTYVAARVFGQWLADGKITKVYVARPNISKAKHRNGFLPGTLEEKTAPWLVPIFEGLKDAMGSAAFERARKEKLIEEVPFEFIQGRTFRSETGSTKGVACIVDEAENLDLDDLYITLTRQGEGLTMVLCGDIYQARIPDSGLAAVIEMAETDRHTGTGVVVFDEGDVVRSRQAAQWVKSFSKRRTNLGIYSVHVGQPNLLSVTERGNDEVANFRENPPEFLKGVA